MVRRSSLHAIVALLAVAILCTAAVGSVGATAETTSGSESTSPTQSIELLQTDGEQNESSPSSHENPADATEPEEPEGIEQHLESMLADRLVDATDEATDGDYEDAREQLDETYDEMLDRYGEVSSEDDAELYSEARDRHTAFIDANERFDDRQEVYREARQEGDDEQAESLRDELQDDAADISESGDELISTYRSLENQTDIDHGDESERINTRQTAVDRFLSETEDAGLITTVLSVEADRAAASFDEPVQLNGQLRTVTGEPVADRPVTVAVDGQSYSVETDSIGRFEIEHRPVGSVGQTTLDVAYRPDETSEYQATNQEIPITVEQVEADIQLDSPESTASFDSELTTTGTVVAGDLNQPAPGISLAVFVDGRQLETIDTDDNGEFELSTPIPRSTDSGTTDIEVRTVDTGQAITSASEIAQIEIEPVATSIALDAETVENDAETVAVSGGLETDDGTPIRDSTVELTVDGETVETVDTGLGRTFETTLTLPESADNSTVTIGAAYDGEGHLLETTESIEFQPQNGQFEGVDEAQPSSSQTDGDRLLAGLPTRELLFAGSGLLALFGLVGLWWVRRDGVASPEKSTVEGPNSQFTPADTDRAESTPASSRQLYSAAEQQLTADAYGSAVVLAYAAVRRQLGQLLELPDGATHREIAQRYALSEGENTEAVEQLTQQYERVRYAADDIDKPTGEGAVSAAKRILDEIDSEVDQR